MAQLREWEAYFPRKKPIKSENVQPEIQVIPIQPADHTAEAAADSVQKPAAEAGVLQEETTEAGMLQKETAEAGVLQEETAEAGMLQEETAEAGVLQEETAEAGMLQEETTEAAGAEPVWETAAALSDGNEADPDMDSLPERKETGIRGMYLFDFLSRMFEPGNRSAIVYMVLTICVVAVISMRSFMLPIGWGFLLGGIIYIAALIIALSPVGEAMLRRRFGCRMIDDREIATRMAPLFREVCGRARMEDPEISGDIRLYMIDHESEQIFATGRRTICMTRGLSHLPDDMIKGLLAHEAGHISSRDVDRLPAAVTANSITAFLLFVIEALFLIFNPPETYTKLLGTSGGAVFWVSIAVILAITFVILLICSRIWSMLGMVMIVRANREKEYEADRFAAKLQMEVGLKKALEYQLMGESPHPVRLFAAMAKSHLPIRDRIRRLDRMNV